MRSVLSFGATVRFRLWARFAMTVVPAWLVGVGCTNPMTTKVRTAATPLLSCTEDKIAVERTYEGPSDGKFFLASGCGHSATYECVENVEARTNPQPGQTAEDWLRCKLVKTDVAGQSPRPASAAEVRAKDDCASQCSDNFGEGDSACMKDCRPLRDARQNQCIAQCRSSHNACTRACAK